jgi:hypothetical protein
MNDDTNESCVRCGKVLLVYDPDGLCEECRQLLAEENDESYDCE